jgi:gliding motility-associated-like protein
MRKSLFIVMAFAGLLLFSEQSQAQCIAEITTSPANGSQTMTMQFFGTGSAQGIDFPCDEPTLPLGWSSTPFTIGSPCLNPDGSAPDLTDYLWVAGRDVSGKRWVETDDMNVPNGGTLSFEIRYGVTDAGSDCRGPNNVIQGVSLEYSTNGGGNWTQITYYLPYSLDTVFTDWNQFQYDIPPAAQTSSTRFRWFQNSASSDDTDRWGLNNIVINTASDVTSYEWDFGDMTTSIEQNPIHIFPDYGVYNVSLTINTSDPCTDIKDTVIYINSTPTIDDLVEVYVNSTDLGSDILLTGISDGGTGGQILTLSATSSNPSSLSVESISYTSPASTGLITVAPDSTSCGDATITAKVEYTNITNVLFEELFTVHVIDKTMPEIECPEDMWLTVMPGKCDTIINYITPVGVDNCPGVTTIQTEGLPTGSLFPVGTTTNTFVATDPSGNEVSCNFNITITESVPPVISCPTDIVASECNNNLTIPAPVATDACGVQSVTHNSPYGLNSSNASGTYPVGVTMVTWTATDYSGNEATCQQRVEILPNPVQPTAPDVELFYGESATLVATPDPDHFIRWYSNSDLSDIPVEASSIDLGFLTPETYYRYASQVSTITGCEGMARAVAAIVSKAELTVTADDKEKVYGETNPLFTFSYSGFVFGEDVSELNEEPTPGSIADEFSDAGTYPISFTGGYDNNYSFIFVEGLLTINRADQTITFNALPTGLRVTESATLDATATSGLPVQYASTDPTIVSFSGDLMIVTKEGTTNITANSDGGINYNPAPEVSLALETFPAFDNSTSLFTPNGDGINDYWHLPFIADMGRVNVKVYNRYGRLVYESTAYANDWDGTTNGNPLPEGAYYYILDSENQGPVKGVVNIVR